MHDVKIKGSRGIARNGSYQCSCGKQKHKVSRRYAAILGRLHRRTA